MESFEHKLLFCEKCKLGFWPGSRTKHWCTQYHIHEMEVHSLDGPIETLAAYRDLRARCVYALTPEAAIEFFCEQSDCETVDSWCAEGGRFSVYDIANETSKVYTLEACAEVNYYVEEVTE